MATGRQLAGLEGTITSWGSSSVSDWHYNLVTTLTSPMDCTISTSAPDIDTTSIDSSGYFTSRNGLKNWTVNATGYWQKSTPKLGIGGLVTFASFYSDSGTTPANIMLHADKWTLKMDWDVIKINEFGANSGTDALFDKYRPAYRGRFTGTIEGNIDSANAVTMPHDWNAASTALKLYLNQNSTITNSEFFSGNARVSSFQIKAPFNSGNLQRWSANYVIDGALTASSGTGSPGANIIPCTTGSGPYTNVITYPTYSSGASSSAADKTLTILLGNTSRNVAGLAFIKSLGIDFGSSDLVKVTADIQGSGALTPA